MSGLLLLLHQLLESNANSIPNQPLIVYVSDVATSTTIHKNNNIDDNNKNSNNNNNNKILRSLSYKDGQFVLLQHEQWLQKEIQQLVLLSSSTSPPTTSTRTSIHQHHYHHDIIIAYLCWNDIDYFLNVLACTKFASTNTKTTTTTTEKSIRSDSTRSTPTTTTITTNILPALLNTRWMTTEIMNVLLNPTHDNKMNENNNNNNNYYYYYTLFIYNDESLQHIANQVTKGLSSQSHHHYAKCILLPNLSHPFFVPITNTTTISPKMTDHEHHRNQHEHCQQQQQQQQQSIAIDNMPSTPQSSSSSFLPKMVIPTSSSSTYTIIPNRSTNSTILSEEEKVDYNVSNHNHDDDDDDDVSINKNTITTTTYHSNNTCNNDAILFFTSGTTATTSATTTTTISDKNGTINSKNNNNSITPSTIVAGAKGVRLSHRSIYIQAYTKIYDSPCSYTIQTKLLGTTIPFFHIGGFSSIISIWIIGGTIVLTSSNKNNNNNNNGRKNNTKTPILTTVSVGFNPIQVLNTIGLLFSPSKLSSSLDDSKSNSYNHNIVAVVNTLVVVPAMIYSLQEVLVVQQQQQCFPNIELILIGGQSITSSLLHFINVTFPNARIVQTYACTEAASSITFLLLKDSQNKIKRTNTPSITTTTNGSSSSSSSSSSTSIYPIDNNYNNVENSINVINPISTIEIATGNNNVLQDYKNNDHPKLNGDCVGTPPSHIELCLVDVPSVKSNNNGTQQNIKNNNNTTIVAVTNPYTVGIIATRGAHVMNGYWQRGYQYSYNDYDDWIYSRRRIDCKLYSNTDWFITNDLGYWDNNGRLYFWGRMTDTIRTGGETVQATEVERIIIQHPNIKECAVFGLPDDRYGEIVCCAIVVVVYQPDNRKQTQSKMTNTTNNTTVREEKAKEIIDNQYYTEELKQWCVQNGLSRYKRPRKVFVVNALPRNSSGKILKFQLVEQFRAYNNSTSQQTNIIHKGNEKDFLRSKL